MKWYKTNINEITNEQYEKYLSMLCGARRARIERKAHREDRIRSVAADMLVRRAVSDIYAVDGQDVVILEDKFGAPYIEGINAHISISHSGDYAACALSDKPIGIDIEKIRPISRRVAERTFSAGELEYLGSGEELCGEALVRFYEIWTAKEAYAKMKGKGMSLHDTPDTAKLTHIIREYPDGYVISISEEGQI